ncbi:MAG: hypothetical protein WBB28_12270 [Crinalium sp.]
MNKINSNITRRTFLKHLKSVGKFALLGDIDVPSEQSVSLKKDKKIYGVTYHHEARLNISSTSFDPTKIREDLIKLSSLGANMLRSDVSFERVSIPLDLALEFDKWYVKEAKIHGLDVLMVIKTKEQIQTCVPFLKDDVTFWQLGNELNNQVFAESIVGKDTNLKMAAKWYEQNATLLKSIHPQAKIVLNPVDLPKIYPIIYTSWVDFYKELLKANIPFDIVGFDSYPGGSYQGGFPSDIARSVITAKKVAEKICKPVWVMETGASTFKRSVSLQADYVNDVVASALQARADGIFIYEAFDETKVKSEVTSFIKESQEIEENFGILDIDGDPKPSFTVYKKAIELDQEGKPIPLSFSSKIYRLIAPFYRLIMPIGGPLGYNDFVDIPKTEFFSGLIFRYIFGKFINHTENISFKQGMGISFGGGSILLGILNLFYRLTGTDPVNSAAKAGFTILQALSIFTGSTQLSVFAAKDNNVKRKLFLNSLIPPLLATLIGTFVGPFEMLYLWTSPLSTLAIEWAERKLYKK